MMQAPELFTFTTNPADNLLPYDGIVNDYGIIFDNDVADNYYYELLHRIAWQHDQAVIYGKRITTTRKVAWYGDAHFNYTYSGITRTALAWSDTLLELKQTIEKNIHSISPTHFNSCLLNLYHDGSEGMAWHSDDEKELGKHTTIASLSFGATRKFVLKHRRTTEKRELLLKHGQLIVMHGSTQSHWLHTITKSKHVSEPRINLTFRTIVDIKVR